MKNEKINAEDKILYAAYNIFLLFGYHGTTLQKIATKAGVNKSAVHYYFRSKERLYLKVVEKILDQIFASGQNTRAFRGGSEKSVWFLVTELYNNVSLFEQTLKELFPNDWDKTLKDIKKWLEIKTVHATPTTRFRIQ
jgi:AcrR family transcriptional regulator